MHISDTCQHGRCHLRYVSTREMTLTLTHGGIVTSLMHQSIPAADLPTSKTCKSGDLAKKPRKTWRLGPQTWRFPKYCKMKIKMVDFLFQGILYLICATYCILLPHFLKSVSVSLSTRGASSFSRDLSTPILTYGFTGMRSELYPAFPQTFGHFQHGFFNIASCYLNCLAILRFSDSP